MGWFRWRTAAALYSALFLLAAAAAPHHHINGLEDILLDERSDSGEVVQTSGALETPTDDRPVLVAFEIVDDIPCLACFCSDSVAQPTQAIRITHTLERAQTLRLDVSSPDLPPIERDAPSRAPPLLG